MRNLVWLGFAVSLVCVANGTAHAQGPAQPTLLVGEPLFEESGAVSVIVGARTREGAPQAFVNPTLAGEGGATKAATSRQKLSDYLAENPKWNPPIAIGIVYLWSTAGPRNVIEGWEALFKHLPGKLSVYPTPYGQGLLPVVKQVTAARVANGELDYPRIEGDQIKLHDAIAANLLKLSEDRSSIKFLFIATDGRDFSGEQEAGAFASIGEDIRRKGISLAVVSFAPPSDQEEAAARLKELTEAARARNTVAERPADVPALMEALAETVTSIEQVRFGVPWTARLMGGQHVFRVQALVDGKRARSAPFTLLVPRGGGLLAVVAGAIVLLAGGGLVFFRWRGGRKSAKSGKARASGAKLASGSQAAGLKRRVRKPSDEDVDEDPAADDDAEQEVPAKRSTKVPTVSPSKIAAARPSRSSEVPAVQDARKSALLGPKVPKDAVEVKPSFSPTPVPASMSSVAAQPIVWPAKDAAPGQPAQAHLSSSPPQRLQSPVSLRPAQATGAIGDPLKWIDGVLLAGLSAERALVALSRLLGQRTASALQAHSTPVATARAGQLRLESIRSIMGSADEILKNEILPVILPVVSEGLAAPDVAWLLRVRLEPRTWSALLRVEDTELQRVAAALSKPDLVEKLQGVQSELRRSDPGMPTVTYLVRVAGNGEHGEFWQISEGKTFIGDPNGPVPLSISDSSIGPRHALIIARRGSFTIEAVDGIVEVDGVAISAATPLFDGQAVRIGATVLAVMHVRRGIAD